MVAKLDKLAVEVGNAPREVIAAAAERFDEIARQHGGVMTIHGAHGRRSRVQLATKVVVVDTFAGRSVAVVKGSPAGPWLWLENGTKPHDIGRRRRDGTVVYLHGSNYAHPIAGPILHLGATAKATWTEAVAEFQGEFPDLAIRSMRGFVSAIR